MINNYANVGKNRNLAQSLLLYTKSICFCRKSASRFFHKSPKARTIPETRLSAFSANFCKFAETLPTILAPVLLKKYPANSLEHGTFIFIISPVPCIGFLSSITRKTRPESVTDIDFQNPFSYASGIMRLQQKQR